MHVSKNRLTTIGLQVSGILAFLIIWDALITFRILAPALFPTPLQLITNFISVVQANKIYNQIEIGMLITLATFAASVGVGLLLGLIFGSSSYLKQVSESYLVLLHAIPKSIFLPALFIALGIGFRFEFFYAFLSAFVIMTLNMMYGVMSVPNSLIVTARSLGASTSRVYLRVVIPAVMPTLLASARLTFGVTYGGILVAQEYVGQTGLGYLVVEYSSVFAIIPLYVIVVIASLIGIAGFVLLMALERYLTRWNRPNF
jgi:ABC-type nitrate/sulfonate/bicarbonate transport system permease component